MEAAKTLHVLDLSLRQFLEKTNRDRPEITGGCVLLTNASFTTAMILMALKISLKKTDLSGPRRFLRTEIKALSSIQVRLADAAENDLRVFDEYRKIFRSKAGDKQQKLDASLEKATDSLLSVCKTLGEALAHTDSSKPYVDAMVASDLEAGHLILEAVYNALLALAAGNIEDMPAASRQKYDRWKEHLGPS